MTDAVQAAAAHAPRLAERASAHAADASFHTADVRGTAAPDPVTGTDTRRW